MLLRSSSTPFLHSKFSSSSSFSSSPSSLQLRRAFSDGHLPSLNPSSPNDANLNNSSSNNKKNGSGGLHTELSFSIYNTFSSMAPAIPLEPHQEQEQEQDEEQAVVQPDLPELPLFLARGMGIDRIASGLFTAGDMGSAVARMMSGVDVKAVMALDAQYKEMVDEQPGNALFLRNYAQFLHEVKGDARRAEEYYSRAMLADPSDGEIISQYAKLVWAVHRDHDRSLVYFQKSVQAAPRDSHVLAAYASFLWEQDEDDSVEEEQGMGGAPDRATGQPRELASAAV